MLLVASSAGQHPLLPTQAATPCSGEPTAMPISIEADARCTSWDPSFWAGDSSARRAFCGISSKMTTVAEILPGKTYSSFPPPPLPILTKEAPPPCPAHRHHWATSTTPSRHDNSKTKTPIPSKTPLP